MIEQLNFKPFPGLSSPHCQTILASLFSGSKKVPPSNSSIISLDDQDCLCCEISTPSGWKPYHKTILLVHGLGGSHTSPYMIRLTRKLYQKEYRVIRINLRGCGSGNHLARLSYHGGISQDLRLALHTLKQQTPLSPFILIGFSLGGNIALKLAGETSSFTPLVDHTIAVCPPIDLARTVKLLSLRSNRLYENYYLKHLQPQIKQWAGQEKITSMYDFDNKITAPMWGFKNADHYYQQSSSCYYLPGIQQSCQILLAKDDPFIDYRSILDIKLSSHAKVSLSNHGGHMGYLGWAGRNDGYFWLDHLLQQWISQTTEEK